MSWSLVATGAIGVATLIILIHVIRKSTQRDELKRLNAQLNESVDELAKSIHLQEKRESNHEMRLIEIAKSHNLSRDRLLQLLDSWPSEDSKTGKAGDSSS